MSLREFQGPACGLHEEPRSPSNPGKLISEEYKLPFLYLKKKKKTKKTNMPLSEGTIYFLPGAASPIPCCLTCLASVLFALRKSQ